MLATIVLIISFILLTSGLILFPVAANGANLTIEWEIMCQYGFLSTVAGTFLFLVSFPFLFGWWTLVGLLVIALLFLIVYFVL